MSSGPAARAKVRPEEYLAMERASAERHEYFQGDVFAMAGGSRAHSLIGANIVVALSNALRDRPCEVHGSDMRVKIEATGLYTYPDATVVCGQARLEDAVGDTLMNPLAIFEVLSDSTESYDRGRKFEQYRTVPSLAAVVLVSQKQPHVEHFARQTDGSWTLREARAGQNLHLPALGCEVAVDALYLKVFAEGATPG
ncbi:MAG: Uma2 family endonuclease [Myxococcota bacterium]